MELIPENLDCDYVLKCKYLRPGKWYVKFIFAAVSSNPSVTQIILIIEKIIACKFYWPLLIAILINTE